MKKLALALSLFTLALLSHTLLFAQHTVEPCDTNTFTLGEGVVLSKTSFRGLSVVDDHVIWASGSRGTVARSIDGGKTFVFKQLKGYEKSDFRDIEAFDSQRAVIMSSGTPAYILQTKDGGNTWSQSYASNDTAIFLDAMDFWDDQNGMIIGDPVNGHFLLMQTNNGGKTWKSLDTSKTPAAETGEAVFAASGTSLQCTDKKDFAFVSGGKSSRYFHFSSSTSSWHIQPSGLASGEPSQGAFSLYIEPYQRIYIVGGDYAKDTSGSNNINTFTWPDQHNTLDIKNLDDYRSCVASSKGVPLIVCGITGVAVFDQRNHRWSVISTQAFNVVKCAKKGKAVFLAGPKGRIARLVSK